MKFSFLFFLTFHCLIFFLVYIYFASIVSLLASVEKNIMELPDDFPSNTSMANLRRKEVVTFANLPCPSQQIMIKELAPTIPILKGSAAEPTKSKGKMIVTSPASSKENTFSLIKRLKSSEVKSSEAKSSKVKSSEAGPTIPSKSQLSQTRGDRLETALAESDDLGDEMPVDSTIVFYSEGP